MAQPVWANTWKQTWEHQPRRTEEENALRTWIAKDNEEQRLREDKAKSRRGGVQEVYGVVWWANTSRVIEHINSMVSEQMEMAHSTVLEYRDRRQQELQAEARRIARGLTLRTEWAHARWQLKADQVLEKRYSTLNRYHREKGYHILRQPYCSEGWDMARWSNLQAWSTKQSSRAAENYLTHAAETCRATSEYLIIHILKISEGIRHPDNHDHTTDCIGEKDEITQTVTNMGNAGQDLTTCFERGEWGRMRGTSRRIGRAAQWHCKRYDMWRMKYITQGIMALQDQLRERQYTVQRDVWGLEEALRQGRRVYLASHPDPTNPMDGIPVAGDANGVWLCWM